MQLIQTGKIVNTHGIHGDVKVMSWARTNEDLLNIDTFYIDGKPYKVEHSRLHKNAVLVKFEGVCNIDDALAIKNKIIYADKECFELDEYEYFVQDLIGLRVLDVDTGRDYGKIRDVLFTNANDVYSVVDDNGKERLVPAIKDCVIDTDIDNGVMHIRPLKGLFDDDEV